MHDQKKIRQDAIDEKTKEINREKIARFNALYAECFALRDAAAERKSQRDLLCGALKEEAEKAPKPQEETAAVYNKRDIEKLNTLLQINPELYTMYNFRRRTLLGAWADELAVDNSKKEVAEGNAQEGGDENVVEQRGGGCHSRDEDLEKELQFSTRVITQDFKCYAAFVHRRWIISQLSPKRLVEVLQEELKQCRGLLKIDERNFHAWGYRRWVCRELEKCGDGLAPTPTDEIAFTESKIGQTFSNYSAWHNRALAFKKIVDGGQPLLEAKRLFDHEVELVEKAMYCDPNDQSAWLYCSWLISLVKEASTTVLVTEKEFYSTIVRRFLAACEEILGEEEGKWPLWMTEKIISCHKEALLEGQIGKQKQQGLERSLDERRFDALRKLVELDPQRAQYYLEKLQSAPVS